MDEKAVWILQHPEFIKKLIPFLILDLVLRAFALWRSANKKQTIWFICLLLVNSLGLLPAAYLLINPETKKSPAKR